MTLGGFLQYSLIFMLVVAIFGAFVVQKAYRIGRSHGFADLRTVASALCRSEGYNAGVIFDPDDSSDARCLSQEEADRLGIGPG